MHLDYDTREETKIMGDYVIWTEYLCKKHTSMVFEHRLCDDYEEDE